MAGLAPNSEKSIFKPAAFQLRPLNLFELVTKEASMQGFLTHVRVDRYPKARAQLGDWIDQGKLKNIEYMLEGIENAGVAFCDLFAGRNFDKTIVRISEE